MDSFLPLAQPDTSSDSSFASKKLSSSRTLEYILDPLEAHLLDDDSTWTLCSGVHRGDSEVCHQWRAFLMTAVFTAYLKLDFDRRHDRTDYLKKRYVFERLRFGLVQFTPLRTSCQTMSATWPCRSP